MAVYNKVTGSWTISSEDMAILYDALEFLVDYDEEAAGDEIKSLKETIDSYLEAAE